MPHATVHLATTPEAMTMDLLTRCQFYVLAALTVYVSACWMRLWLAQVWAMLLTASPRTTTSGDSLLVGTVGPVGNYMTQQLLEPLTISLEQLMRHLWIAGATGSGKSKLIEALCRACVKLIWLALDTVDAVGRLALIAIDPHGDSVDDLVPFLVMLNLPPEKVMILDVTDEEWVLSFNPIERIPGVHPYRQVMELIFVFKRLWRDSWGERMANVMTATCITLLENDLTLLESTRLLTDAEFRARCVANVRHEETLNYWRRFEMLPQREQATWIESTLNKLTQFCGDPRVSRIIGARRSSLNVRDVMDSGKILLVRLAKGELGPNTALLGALLLSKIQLAALSRIDTPPADRKPCVVVVDEAHNFLLADFESSLAELRKFKVGYVLAGQSLAAAFDNSRMVSSLLTNTALQVVFNCSRMDADIYAREMSAQQEPTLVERLTTQPPRHAVVKIRGQGVRLMRTVDVETPAVSEDAVKAWLDAVRRTHCRPVAEVEAEIEERRRAMDERTPQSTPTLRLVDEQQAPSDGERRGRRIAVANHYASVVSHVREQREPNSALDFDFPE